MEGGSGERPLKTTGCHNHTVNTDLALLKVGFNKPVWLCVTEIQQPPHKRSPSDKVLCLMAALVKST